MYIYICICAYINKYIYIYTHTHKHFLCEFTSFAIFRLNMLSSLTWRYIVTFQGLELASRGTR